MIEDSKERLEAFEKVLAELQASLRVADEELDKLKQAQKARTATYQQIMSRKLSLKAALSAFQRHDLI